MRWQWFQWADANRPWVGSEVPCTELDNKLFRACTSVTIGNGHKALFWHSTWLFGVAPIDLASALYKLAWRKKNSVPADLLHDNWTRGLWRMTTAEEMAQFIDLWERLQEVQLTDQPDSITWRWTVHGYYTTKSAYQAQFTGSFSTFNTSALWKAQTEGKHRLFAWLLIHCRIMTADRLSARNWPCSGCSPLP